MREKFTTRIENGQLKVENLTKRENEVSQESKKPQENYYREKIAKFFDDYKDNLPYEIEDLIDKIEDFLKSEFLKDKNIAENLRSCFDIEDKKEFIERMFIALKPLYDFQKSDPINFETIERKNYHKNSGYEQINEILYYEIRSDKVVIHVPASKYIKSKKSLFLVGLKKLAEIVEKKDIKEIEGESWIVGKNPGLAEKFGFTLGEINKDESEMLGVPVVRAYISRNDFLKKYL